MIDKTPKVFISYCWTSEEYKDKVLHIAERLMHDAIDVVIDLWNLKPGQNINKFIEENASCKDIDRVIIFSNEKYATKANGREGGVGKETDIISFNVYRSAEEDRFIPIVMEKDSNGEAFLPEYLKSRFYFDFTGNNIEKEYKKLIRTIYEESEYRKPELGERPEWLKNEEPKELYVIKDEIIEIRQNKDNASKRKIRRFIEKYLNGIKQFYVKNIDEKKYIENFKCMKEYRDLFLEYLDEISLSEKNFGETIAGVFEEIYNSIHVPEIITGKSDIIKNNDLDLFYVHIWELFICSVTLLLHYEMYAEINNLLYHTYFLNKGIIGSSERISCSYRQFFYFSDMIENRIKPSLNGSESRCFTLAGNYICNYRENLPIYTKKSIANADLFLYQVYNGLGLDSLYGSESWFPSLYVYADRNYSIWNKLVSMNFCKKIMPLFGVDNVEELKKRISKCVSDDSYRYEGTTSRTGAAPAILSQIDIKDIATRP